jgi:hypothetical protein
LLRSNPEIFHDLAPDMRMSSPFLRGIDLHRPAFSRTFVDDPELLGASVSRPRAPRRRLDDFRRSASTPFSLNLACPERLFSNSCVLSSADLFSEE